jgi:hypothetical protein
MGMTTEEVLTRLCYYDSRNPDHITFLEDDAFTLERPNNCSCDNCFYGRTKLAEHYLKVREEIMNIALKTHDQVSIGKQSEIRELGVNGLVEIQKILTK